MSAYPLPKSVRLEEFLDRLRYRAPVTSGEAAKRLIDGTLNAVEDELTDIPFDPVHWQTDGRMYPVQRR